MKLHSILVSGRAVAVRQWRATPSAVRLSTRFMSTSEPSYMVDSDERVDAHLVKVPFLSEDVKSDMFKKYCSDPEVWTIKKLSQHFGTSLQRASAVIYLQQKRQNAMLESSVVGIDDKVLATELKIFEKYTQNKDKSLDELAVEMDQTYDTAHLKKIIEKWETHQKRLDNVNQHEAYMKEKMDALADEGIDTSFQETPTDAKRSLEDSYYPELFGDEALEDEKKKLLRRVASETNAKLTTDVAYMLSQFEGEAGSTVLPSYASPTSTFSVTSSESVVGKPNRWKFAFRDLSYMEYKKKVKSSTKDIAPGLTDVAGDSQPASVRPLHIPARTVVLNRSGSLRYATPLEEVTRSWARKHPTSLDMALHAPHLGTAADFDKDEHISQGITAAKLERTKQLKNERSIN